MKSGPNGDGPSRPCEKHARRKAEGLESLDGKRGLLEIERKVIDRKTRDRGAVERQGRSPSSLSNQGGVVHVDLGMSTGDRQTGTENPGSPVSAHWTECSQMGLESSMPKVTLSTWQ